MSDRVALARTIAARAKARFVEVKRERGGGRIVLRSAELLAIKQGRWAEKERERRCVNGRMSDAAGQVLRCR
jgi:hypothetical protein